MKRYGVRLLTFMLLISISANLYFYWGQNQKIPTGKEVNTSFVSYQKKVGLTGLYLDDFLNQPDSKARLQGIYLAHVNASEMNEFIQLTSKQSSQLYKYSPVIKLTQHAEIVDYKLSKLANRAILGTDVTQDVIQIKEMLEIIQKQTAALSLETPEGAERVRKAVEKIDISSLEY